MQTKPNNKDSQVSLTYFRENDVNPFPIINDNGETVLAQLLDITDKLFAFSKTIDLLFVEKNTNTVFREKCRLQDVTGEECIVYQNMLNAKYNSNYRLCVAEINTANGTMLYWLARGGNADVFEYNCLLLSPLQNFVIEHAYDPNGIVIHFGDTTCTMNQSHLDTEQLMLTKQITSIEYVYSW